MLRVRLSSYRWTSWFCHVAVVLLMLSGSLVIHRMQLSLQFRVPRASIRRSEYGDNAQDDKHWISRYNGTCLGSSGDSRSNKNNGSGRNEEPVYGWQKRAPLAVILGTQKGGTYALRAYLQSHPAAAKPGFESELDFLDGGVTQEDLIFRDVSAGGAIIRDVNQYRYSKFFEPLRDQLVRDPDMFAIDKASHYLFLSDRVPETLTCVAPWAKLIVLLREPVERVISAYNMLSRRIEESGRKLTWDEFLGSDLDLLRSSGVWEPNRTDCERRAWEDYLQNFVYIEQTLPLGRGLYAVQLEHWFAAMDQSGKPRSDLLLIRSEEFRNNTQAVYDRVLNFLDLAPHSLGLEGLSNTPLLHQTEPADEPLPDRWLTFMQDFYEPYNQRLYKLLGWDDHVWSASL